MDTVYYVVVASGAVVCAVKLSPCQVGQPGNYRAYKISAPDAETAKNIARELYRKGEKGHPEAWRQY